MPGDYTTVAWALLAGLAVLFIGQYGLALKEKNQGARMVGGNRITHTVAGVIASIRVMVVETVMYIKDMATHALFAFGLATGAIAWIVVGWLQFDPFAWFYTAVAVISSLKVAGLFNRDPVMWIALFAFGAGALYIAREVIRGFTGYYEG